MSHPPSAFYDVLADYYHLIFEDWDRSIERQAAVLHPILIASMHGSALKVLDCACGIGTQAIGFAKSGHHVVASDLSQSAVSRARLEAAKRGLDILFFVSDMTSLAEIAQTDFDVVAALDNALPHLTADQLPKALRAMGSKLKPHGLLIASVRDYDHHIVHRPTIQQPAFYGKEHERRIVHQVWDWIDAESYMLHLYLTIQSGESWASHHFATTYRCLLRDKLSAALEVAGFEKIQWLIPTESGFYQPLVLAVKGQISS
jgi:glycine/sarcosine N-methyltransferase